MRNLPVVLATLGDDAAFRTWTLEQAHITHVNHLADAAVLSLGTMVRRLVLGGGVREVREEANAAMKKIAERNGLGRFMKLTETQGGYASHPLGGCRMAETPELLSALRDFGLGQRGPDALRHEAAQAAGEAGLLPSGPVQFWAQGEWRDINGNASATRFSPLTQITGANIGQLTVAWQWRGKEAPVDLGAEETLPRNLPIYARGKLFTTAGPKRTVVALDPATGKTLWSFQEPETFRWDYSMRASHGKGVAYGEIDGRGVIYIVTPAFFLHAARRASTVASSRLLAMFLTEIGVM